MQGATAKCSRVNFKPRPNIQIVDVLPVEGGMRLEAAELTRNSKAHMLTIPMHTADDICFTILSASV